MNGPGWRWRLTSLFRRSRLSAQTREEMRFHLDMEVEAGLRQGLSPAEARRRARLRAGQLAQSGESADDALGIGWLDVLGLDLRHAARALVRNPGFGVVAVLVVAATVAINTLIFFMLDGVVLRPLPYAAPERLVRLFDASLSQPKFPMSLGHYLDYRAHAGSLEGIALYTGADKELSGLAGASRALTGVAITADYFQVLGRTPMLGRPFEESDLKDGVRHVILGARLWRDVFRADSSVIGTTIRLNRDAWTVVGVAPDGFEHVGGDYRSPLQGETVDIWVPLALDQSEVALRQFHYCNAIARLRPGVAPGQALAELERLAADYQRTYPQAGTFGVRMEPLASEVTGRSRDVIWLLVAAGGLVLLVAGANIAGLTIARAVARRRELALRRALGASRWQIVRVGLTENVLIGVAGAAGGLALAGAGLPLLRHLMPADFPRAHEIGLTPRAALFAVAAALVTAVVAGLIGSGGGARIEATPRMTGGRDSRRLRTLLVASEIALAGLLCAGTLFLVRSYQRIDARDHGFVPSGALTFKVAVPVPPARAPGDLSRPVELMRLAIARLPGVTAVGASTNLPWSGYDENTDFSIVGVAARDGAEPGSRFQAATPGYFAAIGMRLREGRVFDSSLDIRGQPASLIVNDALARRYFPRDDAVGSRIRVFGEERQIVGVVAGAADTPTSPEPVPALWFPLDQVEFAQVSFAVRTATGDPASLAPAVRAAIATIDPDLPLADVRTLEARATEALAGRRFALWLFQGFAVMALGLAAAGVYGLLAYLVRQRRRELGIRVALGASRRSLGALVLADGLRMAALGAAICLGLIPLAGRLLETFLFNVRTSDPLTMTTTPLALLAVAILASLGPALSAMRADPARTLRED